ncbi:MAG: type II toxin-antitoxin system HigB family toxin [Ginsengibacter sp.]|jgi:mRNA interferase HigB
MRIHLIKEKTIRKYVIENAGSKASFEDWISKLKFADWNLPVDIMKTFPSADLLGRGSARVIFDIAGNRFRMICKYGFGENEIHLFICWIGRHSEYDKLCKEEKQYTINTY